MDIYSNSLIIFWNPLTFMTSMINDTFNSSQYLKDLLSSSSRLMVQITSYIDPMNFTKIGFVNVNSNYIFGRVTYNEKISTKFNG